MINSKSKGKRGELSWAKFCASEGYPMRRSEQYCGGAGDADCIPVDGEQHALSRFHHEVKCVERLNIYDAMAQSMSDAGKSSKTPLVAHKRNHGRWLVTMLAEDWFALVRAAEELVADRIRQLAQSV